MQKRRVYFILICVTILLYGCEPLTMHKVATTIFDGVPTMPSPEKYCYEYHQQTLHAEQEEAKRKAQSEKISGQSSHRPYEDKRCNDCHNKETDSGFVTSKEELCGVCHKNLLDGKFAHGPAAVGSCLECHVPHNSQYPRLLKKDIGELCSSCHHEKRQAERLHNAVAAKGISCVNCHNPHSGNKPFFLI